LRRQLRRLSEQGMGLVVGLEVEWYLMRVAQETLTDENIGAPGVRGQPLKTTPPEPGFSYHSESNMDLMQPVLSALGETYAKLDLPLRSIENEWGPGQVECTFAAGDALKSADDLVLFRTATKQVCRRMGHMATFMCRPGLKGYYSSGWHLHQSVIEAASGKNLLTPEREGDVLSRFGCAFVGGLLKHAASASAFTTPTVNAYRRFRPNSLAPDRATWCYDHRGVMIRALGGVDDPATRLENRVGEPAANPYLFIMSQIVAGLNGVTHALDPGPQNDEPYVSDRPLLPTSLAAALDALEREPLFRKELGDIFLDYFLKLKRNELGRFERWQEETGVKNAGDETTEWEQREYFDFF
jgi:glutamine synthetase